MVKYKRARQTRFQTQTHRNMSSTTTTSKVLVAVTLLFLVDLVTGCLITNCPRGGKRSGSKYGELGEIGNVKQCISCGPGGAGQCFGPRTCCGPFGCLLGTPETVRCRRDGMFHDSEPCIAGSMNCRKNSGRCAAEGLCCSQGMISILRVC